MRRRPQLVLALLLAAAPAAAQDAAPKPPAEPPAPPRAAATTPAEEPDPSKREVALPAANGWGASLVYDNDVGVWTVESFRLLRAYGSPDVVGLDDKGRCSILSCYSGKWARFDTIGEGKWLGGLAFADLDPRRPGSELYTGGELGNLYQVVEHKPGVFSVNLIAELPGREIHTLVAGDLDPARPGAEMVMFTRPGGMYLVTPSAEPGAAFEVKLLGELEGRVRQALLLPARAGEAPEIATVARSGRVATVQLTAEGPKWTTVHDREMGFGRLALRPRKDGDPVVLYAGCDDGMVYRYERGAAGAWRQEPIYAGPQGVRGVAAGRFDADPSKETLAVFGYSHKVQLLTRGSGGWKAETIFEDRDKGHWMCAAELDGRNGTDEIVCSGYGARVVLLSRPPGYGLPAIATDPADPPAK
jgi:hypothetical protein